MSGGQAEGREEAQTSLCCGRTALAEDCMEKNPEVWEDLVYTRLSPDNSLHCTNFEGEAVLKPAISSPSLAAEFALKQNQSKTKALALVLLNQQCQKPLSSNAGPSNSRAQLPPHRLSLCGACPVWSRACLTASTSLSPAGSSTWREATEPAAPSQAVQTRREAWAVVFLGLTLAPSQRPQLSPEMLGNIDPVCWWLMLCCVF